MQLFLFPRPLMNQDFACKRSFSPRCYLLLVDKDETDGSNEIKELSKRINEQEMFMDILQSSGLDSQSAYAP